MPRGLLLRLSAAVFALVTAGLGCLGVATPADAAPGSHCLMSGGIGGPNPARPGDAVSATVAVRSDGSGPSCNADTVKILGGPWVLCSKPLTSGTGGCEAHFGAFPGLSTVTARLSDGESLVLGTFTVVSSTPTHGPSNPGILTVTVTSSASRSAASAAVAAASRAAAAASASRAATAIRTSTVTSTAFPSDSTAPTSAAAASDSPAASSATATGFSVNVRTYPSGGSSIPAAPLLLALVVLGGFVFAAVRFVYLHAHEELEA